MKSPSYPSPTKTAAAQGASNRETAVTQQLLNQTNQITPWGNLTYNQSGSATQVGADGKPFTTPTFTSTTTLSPTEQRKFDQTQAADIGQNDIALSQIDRMKGHLSTPFQMNNEAAEARIGELSRKRLDPMWDQREAAFEQKMANQGVAPGSEAYNNARRTFDVGRNDAYNSMLLDARSGAMNEMLTERNQPINEVASLTSGSQVNQPQFQSTPQAGVNGVDIAALINGQYQAKAANQQSMMGGLSGLGSAALGGWMASDERLKTDVKKVGEFPGGINKYSFRYKGSPLKRLGAMAQEVKKTKPQSVAKMPSGYLAVKYNAQGAPA